MKLSPGSRWKSAVCETQIVIVRPPKDAGLLACGGAPLIPVNEESPANVSAVPELMGGSLLGKRYADEAQGLEVLCTKPGQGTLSFGGRPLIIREAKKLPSSD